MKKKEIGMLIGSLALTATMTACGAQNESVISDNTGIISETSSEEKETEESTVPKEEDEAASGYEFEQIVAPVDGNYTFPGMSEHTNNPWLSYYFNYTNKEEATQARVSSGCSGEDAEALVNVLDKYFHYTDCPPGYLCPPDYIAATIDRVLLGNTTAEQETHAANELLKMAEDPDYIPDLDNDGTPDWGTSAWDDIDVDAEEAFDASGDGNLIPDNGSGGGSGSGGGCPSNYGEGCFQFSDPPPDSCPTNYCAAGFQGIY